MVGEVSRIEGGESSAVRDLRLYERTTTHLVGPPGQALPARAARRRRPQPPARTPRSRHRLPRRQRGSAWSSRTMTTKHNLADYEAAGLDWHHVPGAGTPPRAPTRWTRCCGCCARSSRKRGAVAVHGNRLTDFVAAVGAAWLRDAHGADPAEALDAAKAAGLRPSERAQCCSESTGTQAATSRSCAATDGRGGVGLSPLVTSDVWRQARGQHPEAVEAVLPTGAARDCQTPTSWTSRARRSPQPPRPAGR